MAKQTGLSADALALTALPSCGAYGWDGLADFAGASIFQGKLSVSLQVKRLSKAIDDLEAAEARYNEDLEDSSSSETEDEDE